MTRGVMTWTRTNPSVKVNYKCVASRMIPNAAIQGMFRVDCDVKHDFYNRFRGLVVPFDIDGDQINYDIDSSVEMERGTRGLHNITGPTSYPPFKEVGQSLHARRIPLLEAILGKMLPIVGTIADKRLDEGENTKIRKTLPDHETDKMEEYHFLQWVRTSLQSFLKPHPISQSFPRGFSYFDRFRLTPNPQPNWTETHTIFSRRQGISDQSPKFFYTEGKLNIQPEDYGKQRKELIELPGAVVLHRHLRRVEK